MIYVYVLYSNRSKQKYIGITNDIERRIHEHNSWQNKSTKWFWPYILVYCEKYIDRVEARKREKYLKSWIWREFLKKYSI